MAPTRKTRKPARSADNQGSAPIKSVPAGTMPSGPGAPATKPRRGSLPLLIASGIGLVVWLIFLGLTAYG